MIRTLVHIREKDMENASLGLPGYGDQKAIALPPPPSDLTPGAGGSLATCWPRPHDGLAAALSALASHGLQGQSRPAVLSTLSCPRRSSGGTRSKASKPLGISHTYAKQDGNSEYIDPERRDPARHQKPCKPPDRLSLISKPLP